VSISRRQTAGLTARCDEKYRGASGEQRVILSLGNDKKIAQAATHTSHLFRGGLSWILES